MEIATQESTKYSVGFKNLKISCIIGLFPEERVEEQEILIDLEVFSEPQKIIDYRELRDVCVQVANRGYHLLETLAKDILSMLLQKFPILFVEICMKKHGALLDTDFTFVKLSQKKNDELGSSNRSS